MEGIPACVIFASSYIYAFIREHSKNLQSHNNLSFAADQPPTFTCYEYINFIIRVMRVNNKLYFLFQNIILCKVSHTSAKLSIVERIVAI